MTLNHSKSITTVVSLLCVPSVPKRNVHSRDTCKLIYCDLMSCATPACFNTFLIYILWSLLCLEIPNFLDYLFV